MAYYQSTTPHDDVTPRRPLTQDDIAFLTELQTLLNTQDNMGQADPRFWVIKDSQLCPDTLFLTHDDAENHLRKYEHNYRGNAHAFAMTAIRSPRVETLWKLLQTVDFQALATDYISKQRLMDALDKEQDQLEHIEPDGENDITWNIRKSHYNAELRAVRYRLSGLFRKGD